MTDKAIFPRPKEISGVILPGLPVLPFGVERHPVPGGGSRAVAIFTGDEITLQDVEGLQPTEVVFFSPQGKSDSGMIGAEGGRNPVGLKASLLQHPSGHQVVSALAKSGFDLAGADGTLVFCDSSQAGDTQSYVASCDGLLIVCAAGGEMDAHTQWAPSEVILYIKRRSPIAHKGGVILPDPLSDPLIDINIQPGEAKPYTVKAGEFIQVLDVKGRECSDFQAFSLRALDKGVERDIDPTTTRSLS